MASRSIWVTSKAYLQYRQDSMNSSVKSCRKIFAVVHEFRSIERFLAQWGLESKWGPVKDKAKFKCYIWNYNRLEFAGRKRFLPVMRKEFGEMLNVSNELFSGSERKKLKYVSEKPGRYIFKAHVRDIWKTLIQKG